MKKSSYLQLNRIEFVTTYHCSGRCKHCSVGHKLNMPGSDHVAAKESAEAVRWLASHFPIDSIMTFGGEPLLYPELTASLHAAARDSGIPTRQLITNGYFSKAPERIREVARQLAEAGVNDVLLSVDSFHQERIPLEPVKLFAQCFQKAAPGCIQLQPSWVVNREHRNTWNEKTEAVLKEFAEFGIPTNPGDDIFMAGNAIENLAAFYPPPALDMGAVCGTQPYTEPLTAIRSLSVEPNGDVIACAWPIGNLKRQTMEEIVAGYNPFANRFTQALIQKGAWSLLKEAEDCGIQPDLARCYSVCDLCRQVSKKYKETDVFAI